MYYCSICLIVKDDHDYIREWIQYHLSIGIDHFYITDNGSEPPLDETIHDYIEHGLVTYRYDTRQRPQCAVYNECIQRHRDDCIWIAFIDSDEFIVLKRHVSIKEFLQSYEQYGSLSVGWYLFGSNGHQEKQKLVLPSYTKRIPISNYYKTIVRPSHVAMMHVHNVEHHTPDYFTVDEMFSRVSGPFPIYQNTSLIQLNHYVLRSHQDFEEKLARGGGTSVNPRNWYFFEWVNKKATVEDTSAFTKVIDYGKKESYS